MREAIPRLQRRIDDLKAFDVERVLNQRNPDLEVLENSIASTLQRVFGSDTVEARRYSGASTLYSPVLSFGGHGPSLREIQTRVREGIDRSVGVLQGIIRLFEEELEHAGEAAPPAHTPASTPIPRSAFVVHGHDQAAREAVARFLERIDFEAIILHEQANRGRTVIEKVEAHGNVGFAVVLLTPDDVGAAQGGELQPRARQNVLLELGYFIGRLGRDRVCALKGGDLELPSDFGGVVYQPFDAGGGWKQALGRELEAAGFEIDWNRVMRS